MNDEPSNTPTATPKPGLDDLPDFLTTAEYAALLRCKPQTARRNRWAGNGPPALKPFGPRGRTLYAKATVLAWLRDRTSNSTTEETAKGAA